MPLQGKKVAMIVAPEFDEREFKEPYERLAEQGAQVIVIGVEANKALVSHHRQEEVITDVSFDEVSPDEFDAVIIPGGYSPDKLRMSKKAVAFVRTMYDHGKLVAAICHAPSLLISAGIVRDKTVTSWPSIEVDLKNAGAHFVDAEVAIDGNLVTSRNVSDLPTFIQMIINFLEGRAQGEQVA